MAGGISIPELRIKDRSIDSFFEVQWIAPENCEGETMTYAELFEFAETDPFRPFRLQMASGRTFDVRHPENIRIGENSVVVFQFRSEKNNIFERFQMLGLSLIESIEHIDQPIVQDEN